MATLERLGASAIRDTITSYRDALRTHAAALNRLNVYPVPDGDTGTNMACTLDAVVAELAEAPGGLAPTCRAIAHGSLMGARGNSGVILSQILRGLTGGFEAAGDLDPGAVSAALAAAATAAYDAVLEPVEGTILTVVREVAAAAGHVARAGGTLVEVLAAARARGEEALQRTPDQLPLLKAAGVVDAGGAGFLLLLDAALHVVDGRPVPEPAEDDGTGVTAAELATNGAESGFAGPRYEVMYFLDLGDDHIEHFKRTWSGIGDSIVVVGGDGLWNCHVHTNDIGAAIEAGLDDGGRPSKVRVTDLYDQVGYGHPSDHRGPAATRRCAVVAVAAGGGLGELFRRLGVDRIVPGGQAMNPSTTELLDAVEHVLADEIVILPNNENVVPVAEQIPALTAKRVVVVPTRSAIEAIAALVVYDGAGAADVNAEKMAAACEGVLTGEVTQAVRAASSAAGPVTTGDWLGLTVEDGIVAVAGSVAEAATALLGTLVTDRHEIVTVIEGVDATPAATESILGWLAEHRPGANVEVHAGGQPHSAYLFGAE